MSGVDRYGLPLVETTIAYDEPLGIAGKAYCAACDRYVVPKEIACVLFYTESGAANLACRECLMWSRKCMGVTSLSLAEWIER